MGVSRVALRDAVAELCPRDGGQNKYKNCQQDRAGQAPHNLPGNDAHGLNPPRGGDRE